MARLPTRPIASQILLRRYASLQCFIIIILPFSAPSVRPSVCLGCQTASRFLLDDYLPTNITELLINAQN